MAGSLTGIGPKYAGWGKTRAGQRQDEARKGDRTHTGQQEDRDIAGTGQGKDRDRTEILKRQARLMIGQ